MAKDKAQADLNLRREEKAKYTELFKRTKALVEIRKQYTLILNEKFINAEFLRKYQDSKKKINDQEMNMITAANAIQKAYPQVVYKDGKPIDNREQNYIAAVENFVKNMELRLGRHEQLHKNEQELLLATKVYAALNSVENSWAILQQRIADKKAAAEDEKPAYDDAIKIGLETFSNYCENLKESLKGYQHVLKRGERAVTWFGMIINAIEDLIKSIKSYKNLKAERVIAKVDQKPNLGLYYSKETYIKDKKDSKLKLEPIKKEARSHHFKNDHPIKQKR